MAFVRSADYCPVGLGCLVRSSGAGSGFVFAFRSIGLVMIALPAFHELTQLLEIKEIGLPFVGVFLLICHRHDRFVVDGNT